MLTIKILNSNRARIEACTEPDTRIDYKYDLQQYSYHMHAGYECDIETGAVGGPLAPGCIYQVSGTWLNYTKTNPPQFTLAVTRALIMEPKNVQP